MTVDIVWLASIIGAFTIIGGVLYGVFKFYEKIKTQSEEIKHIKKEQTLVIFALRACLDGLQQRGCNGRVTEALDKVDTHINLSAHDEI